MAAGIGVEELAPGLLTAIWLDSVARADAVAVPFAGDAELPQALNTTTSPAKAIQRTRPPEFDQMPRPRRLRRSHSTMRIFWPRHEQL